MWVQARVTWDEGKSWALRSGGQGCWVMPCKASASTPLMSHIGCVGEIYFGPELSWIRSQDTCVWLLFPWLHFPSPPLPLPGRALGFHLCLRTGQLPFVLLCYCLFESHSQMSEIFTWYRENYLEPRRSFSLLTNSDFRFLFQVTES